MLEKVIHYEDIYEALAGLPANNEKLLKIFAKLYEWRKNDKRKRLNASTI